MCSASCIIHLHRSGLASATPAPVRARYICCSGSWNDISDPSLSRYLGDPPFAPSRFPSRAVCVLASKRDHLSSTPASSSRRRDALSFSPLDFCHSRRVPLRSPAAHIHSLSSHISFLLSFPSVNFACQRVLCSGGGERAGRGTKGHLSERGRTMSHNSNNSAPVESFMTMVIVSQ